MRACKIRNNLVKKKLILHTYKKIVPACIRVYIANIWGQEILNSDQPLRVGLDVKYSTRRRTNSKAFRQSIIVPHDVHTLCIQYRFLITMHVYIILREYQDFRVVYNFHAKILSLRFSKLFLSCRTLSSPSGARHFLLSFNFIDRLIRTG